MWVYIAAAAVIIYIAAKITWLITGRRHKMSKQTPKLPGSGYQLIYTDQKQVERKADVIYGAVLKCEGLNISGKPDYIFRGKKDGLLPVELKSGAIGQKENPYDGDLMQLAAYFAIVEEHFGETPIGGLIIYKDYMFRVQNTKRLRRKLKGTLRDMRDMLKTGEGEPAASFIACKNCVCKNTVCEYCE